MFRKRMDILRYGLMHQQIRTLMYITRTQDIHSFSSTMVIDIAVILAREI